MAIDRHRILKGASSDAKKTWLIKPAHSIDFVQKVRRNWLTIRDYVTIVSSSYCTSSIVINNN